VITAQVMVHCLWLSVSCANVQCVVPVSDVSDEGAMRGVAQCGGPFKRFEGS
jgi:hypothetical protein